MRPSTTQLSFADLEFLHQGLTLDRTLQAIADFLDAHGALVQRVRRDLTRGLKRPRTGRAGLTPQQVLRSLVLMRVKHWDYRELRERIADGYTLRVFTQFQSRRVPKHDAFNRAFNRLTPATLQALNDAIVHAAVALKLEDGRKLRVDTTVVQTDIHHPTDNTLLWDSVRVLTRLVHTLDKLLPAGAGPFPNRTRSAKRRMHEIQRMTMRDRQRRQRRTYEALIRTTTDVVTAAQAVVTRAGTVKRLGGATRLAVDGVCAEIARHCGLATSVIRQTRRRVIDGEQVPADEKLYSIFETHTDLIVRGKVLTPAEFGHKVFLAESGHGLITQYTVLQGNPADQTHVEASLVRHQAMFDASPTVYAGDRGFFNEANLDACRTAGVELACIPYAGGKRNPERDAAQRTRAFKRGQRFRAGIEGRISVLFRGRGMKRALVEGRDRFEVFVGAAVIANNLLVIAELLRRKAERAATRHRPAA
jgi:transposase, IS5 family